jgi:uncharacterized membrane protein (UPF0127 family)
MYIMWAMAFIPWPIFYSQSLNTARDQSILKVQLGNKNCDRSLLQFDAKVARSPESRAKGFSGRVEPLNKNEAMIFIFKPMVVAQAWMKNTFIPLQIGFFDEKGKLIETHSMEVEPNPFKPAKMYSSPRPASVALEFAPGTLPQGPSPELHLCVQASGH